MNGAGAQSTVDDQQSRYGRTQRGLKGRHVQLIALGGCIGTGLFVGTGSTLSLAGPAPLFLCECVCCFCIRLLLTQCQPQLS